MKKPIKIDSGFAIIDVKKGRKALKHYVESRYGQRVKVHLEGYIDQVHGNDDGISQEFQMIVETIGIKE